MRISPAAAFILGALLIVHPSSARAGSCPMNSLNCNAQSIISSAPSDNVSCGDGGSSGRAMYSIPLGILETSGNSFLLPPGSSIAFETVADSFVVVGAGSLPVSIQARLHINTLCIGSSNGSGQFTIKMSTASNQVTWTKYENTIIARDTTVTLPIQATPNQPFKLSFYSESYGTGNGSAKTHAQLSFADIPQGTAIASCQGYQQDPPVPTQSLSWGRLRAHYR